MHLLRALKGVHHDVGFYIDVGAWDPESDSVTKLFYDHGWHGINVEPSPGSFARLVEQRPRDINLQVAVSETPGEIPFYDYGGFSTTVEAIARHHEASRGRSMKRIVVKTLTLSGICEQYAPKDVHFLKIDIEGGEAGALRSMDFQKYRPWILCIECHFPERPDIQTYEEWEPYVLDSGYNFVFTDGWKINRYYVAKEHGGRGASFEFPAEYYILPNNGRK